MPTFIARGKRTRALYVVLLCVAMAMSTWAIYNQVHSDSTSAQLADQIAAFCEQNPAYVGDQLNCQQAKDVQNNDSPVIAPPKGDKGDKGETGPKGDSIMGPKGEPGTNGTNGTNGQNGHDGNDGQNGQDGQSIEGPQGEKGQKGDKGDPGNNGVDGQPAPRITDVDMDMSSCTGTMHLSDGTSFPINMTGCNQPLIGGE